MEELLNGYEFASELRVHDKVTGTVVTVKDNELYLDINQATEGKMHLDHYTKDNNVTSFKATGVKVGDVIECEVSKIMETKDGEPVILLSRLNQIKAENFQEVVEALNYQKVLNVLIKAELPKGYTAVYNGVNMFMPKSQATANVKVGANIDVKVLEADEERSRAVVSRRVIEQEEYQDAKAKELEAINVGDVLTGTIVKIEKFGAFVKFNLVQGLLKTNQIAHEFVDINAVLSVGQEIEVKVVGKNEGKVELSRKALLKTPFNLYAEAHKVGETVTGKVSAKLPFGLLIELAPNVKGLLHASEYSHNPNDNFNNCVIIGDEVTAAILAIDENKEKIGLSRKALIDNPWKRVDAKEGDLVDYKVTEVKENGLVVEALGVDAFIPAREALEEDKKNAGVGAYFAVGDAGKAYIIDIKPEQWKMVLSIRKYTNEEERKSFEKYLESEEVTSSALADQLKNLK